MLDRSTNASVLEPLAPAGESIRMDAQEGKAYRVAGEDAPAWLAACFAIIGTVIACVSVSALEQNTLGSAEVAPPSLAAQFERPPQVQDDVPAGPPPQGREVLIPPPHPASDSPPPPPAASTAAPALIAEAAPAATIPPTETLAVPERKAATAECFGPLAIGFARNSAQPNADDVRRSLEPLRRWRSTHGDAIILIEGHSDTTGAEDVNVLLSYSRAKAVASQLKREGVPAQQMTIRAAGASEAVGGAAVLASDRNALLRIAGVEDCGVETATRGP
jgi:outer membrane protein OmpA-like peptidoglycan-associated protein